MRRGTGRGQTSGHLLSRQVYASERPKIPERNLSGYIDFSTQPEGLVFGENVVNTTREGINENREHNRKAQYELVTCGFVPNWSFRLCSICQRVPLPVVLGGKVILPVVLGIRDIPSGCAQWRGGASAKGLYWKDAFAAWKRRAKMTAWMRVTEAWARVTEAWTRVMELRTRVAEIAATWGRRRIERGSACSRLRHWCGSHARRSWRVVA